jgi:hypothetical protein
VHLADPTLVAALVGPVVAFLLGRLGKELTQRASQRAAMEAKADSEREAFRSMVTAKFERVEGELGDVRSKLAGIEAVLRLLDPRLREPRDAAP